MRRSGRRRRPRRPGGRRLVTSAAAAPGRPVPSAAARPARPGPGTAARPTAAGSTRPARPGPARSGTSACVYIDIHQCLWQTRHEKTSIAIYIWEAPVPGRIQLALNVDDLGESIAFYSKLFGTQPAKVKPGYANFAIAEPALKLVLLENPGQGGSLNHLGVEVADTDTVEAEQARLAEEGLAAVEERDTTCCYARQDKFWVKGAPDGERWEIYTVLGDSP